VVTRTEMALAALQEMMTPPAKEPFGEARVLSIRETTSQLISDMSSKEP
jgi:hypothetical protein